MIFVLQEPLKLLTYLMLVTAVVKQIAIPRFLIDAEKKHTTTLANGEEVVCTYRVCTMVYEVDFCGVVVRVFDLK